MIETTNSSESNAPKSREGVKRAICVVEPDTDLADYMAKHNITKWWPDIYEKLGATSIADLGFIGRAACEKFLTGLPALPIMRLAALAEDSSRLKRPQPDPV